jgi:hypothetical protein
MSAVRELPARPSLDSLGKQAKRLARDAAEGNGGPRPSERPGLCSPLRDPTVASAPSLAPHAPSPRFTGRWNSGPGQ